MKTSKENANDEWKKKNNKAMAYITLSVEDNQLVHFAHLEEANKAWEALRKKYERSTYGSRLYLRRKLYSIQYRDGKMCQHIDAIMEVVSLLRGSGKPLEDEEVVAVLLVSLPESYSGLITALEGRDEADLTIEYVTGKIMDEYQRRIETCESDKNNSEAAMKSSINKNDPRLRKTYNKVNARIKDTRICFFCKKPGHLKANCYHFKRTLNKETGNDLSKLSVMEKENTAKHVTFKIDKEAGNIDVKGWCIDSGASNDEQENFFLNIKGY